MILVSFIIGLFITAAGILPLKLSRKWEITLTVLVFLGAFKGHIQYIFGGPYFFAPNLPNWILWIAAFYYAVIFFLFMLLGIAWVFYGIFLLVQYLLHQKYQWERWRKWLNRVHPGILILSFIAAGWSISRGNELPIVKKISIPVQNLPEQAENMTIAVLTDLHIDKLTPPEKLPAIVKMCNDLKPDLIVILGDFADGIPSRIGYKLHPLTELKAKYGVFGVPGNHEYYHGVQRWIEFLSTLKIQFLLNRSVCLPNGLRLAGTTDPAAKNKGGILPDPVKATRNIPAGEPVVLMAHQPKVFLKVPSRVALQISGHTHGGMIIGLNYLVALLNHGWVSGLYKEGNSYLYVSNGTAIWQGFPIRLGCPPEITLIRLTSAAR